MFAKTLQAALFAAIAVAAYGCANWDAKKHTLLKVGDPMCTAAGTKERIWESEGTNASAVDCAVSLRYRAPESNHAACSATIYWTQANGTPGPGDGPVRAGAPMKAVAIPATKLVEMSCQGIDGATHDSCHYEIDSVSCVKAGDAVNTTDLGAMMVRNNVACGAPAAAIWSKPAAPEKNQSCNVTVAWSGSDNCTGMVTVSYPGNRQISEAPPKRSKLMTFVGITGLEFQCRGTGPGESCSYSIVSTECK